MAGLEDTRGAKGKAAAYAVGLLQNKRASASVAAVSALNSPRLKFQSSPASALCDPSAKAAGKLDPLSKA